MVIISYCDNNHCHFNKEFKCDNPEDIILDENGTCSVMKYDEKESPERSKDLEEEKKDITHFSQDNDWFKVV